MTYLAIFGRAIRPGHTKTRLIPALGPEGAASLYEGFLIDLIDKFRGEADEVELWVAEEPDHPSLDRFRNQLSVRQQPKGDLGIRMHEAMRTGLEQHAKVVIIGSDSPTLPEDSIARAFDLLDHRDVAFGPSADGGYFLVGGKRVLTFKGVRWSQSTTLQQSKAHARQLGLSVGTLPPFYDVDRPEDLLLLRAHIEVAPEIAPRTAKILARLPVDP